MLKPSQNNIYFSMTTFTDFNYNRPNLSKIKGEFTVLLKHFDSAKSADTQNEIIGKINAIRNNFETMWNLAHVRHTIDTKDSIYESENAFFDDATPEFQALVHKFYQSVVQSTFKAELKTKWGKQFFNIAEMTVKTFTPSILEDLKRENQLTSEYVKLRSSANIKFEGGEYNLAGMQPFMQSPNREIREQANSAYWGFFDENTAGFDRIYDDLVKIRTKIAHKLGFENFIELGYLRMLRSDYNATKVGHFRELIHKHIVPIANQLRQRQARRLSLDSLKYYDISFNFKSGNATPKGSPEWIVKNGKDMYEEMSKETGSFFNYMLDKDLLDLVNKKGKAGGGYCTYIPNEKSPFIFSNFNGTSHDIDVLTHEAGHAFQVFQSRNFEIPEYNWPTSEACEIHSMSMEFFAWPWMENFFKEDVDKYKFSHLSGALLFLPYGVSVDEFQHIVYANPDMTPQERKMAWKNIEKKYLPHLDYDDNSFLNGGGFWQKQGHIFEVPFYYIDYTLAQICAFQFWKKSQAQEPDAFDDYLRLCQAGGSRSFLELVDYANLESPFNEKSFTNVIGDVEGYLESVDDLVM